MGSEMYKQLTLKERYHIQALIKVGYKQKEIAKEVGCSKSTISRELKRNSNPNGYKAESAEVATKQRHKSKPKDKAITKNIEKYIRKHLKLDWSPEQISGRMAKETDYKVSHETIYKYIYDNKSKNGKLYKNLRHKNKKYHKRGSQNSEKGVLKDRVMIEKRPKIVDKKVRFGDLEIDTVIGKEHRGALVTVVDRKSKFALIKRVNTKSSTEVKQALIDIIRPIKSMIHTITSDNGKEFAQHKEIAKELGIDYYFANPYHSWERGLNEHTNGLIRQYLPKGSEFTNVSKEQIATIQNRLNHRPRKSLGYKTPYEVFMTEYRRMVKKAS